MGAFFGLLLSALAVFLILLVLVQRGRGGGLAGALGGVGGSSAFGAKAGDVFTRITIVTAAIWIAVCVAAVIWATNRADRFGTGGPAAPVETVPFTPQTNDVPGESAQPGANVPPPNDAVE